MNADKNGWSVWLRIPWQRTAFVVIKVIEMVSIAPGGTHTIEMNRQCIAGAVGGKASF
jgi:hypothetical protein